MDVHFSYRGLHFTWSGSKAIENRLKHGVNFESACEVFFDDLSEYVDASVPEEERSAVIGLDLSGRMLFVVHVAWDDEEEIRIISAREAEGPERKTYEDG